MTHHDLRNEAIELYLELAERAGFPSAMAKEIAEGTLNVLDADGKSYLTYVPAFVDLVESTGNTVRGRYLLTLLVGPAVDMVSAGHDPGTGR